VAGTISALSSTSISVHSVVNLTCRITSRSPSLGGYAVGEHVGIGCVDGVLTHVRHAVSTAPAPAPGASTSPTTPTADHATTTTAATPTASTASGVGAITAINTTASTITVTGDRSLTCTIVASSPSVSGFHLGDQVRIGCVNGTLYAIAATSSAPPATTTTATTTTATTTTTTPTTAVTSTSATGTLTALSSTSITVTGDGAPLTCPIGPGAQSLTGFHIGDAVRMYCVGGTFYKLISTATTPPATTTTTTTPAPAPTPTTTTTPVVYTSVTGTLTALTSTSITTTGDGGVVTCSIGAGAQSPTGAHVGDQVRMYCENGAFYKLIDPVTTSTATTTTTTTAPPPPPPTTTTTPVTYSSATGTITTLSADRITVTGDAVLSCAIGTTSPSVTAYHLGESVKMYCQGSTLYALSAN